MVSPIVDANAGRTCDLCSAHPTSRYLRNRRLHDGLTATVSRVLPARSTIPAVK